MTARLTPYLSFVDDARAAMEFYSSVFGGELNVMTFADQGGMGMPEERQHHVMHADLTVSDSVMVMGADMGEHAHPNGSLSLSGDDPDRLRGWWDGLSEGGEIKMPLEQAPWGDFFGQLTDAFGISWMFNISTPPEE